MSKPILYSYWRSSCSWRVRAALTFKNIDYEYRSVQIAPGVSEQLRPEFIAISPLGQVPAYVVEKDEQKCTLVQSVAIMNFLEETYPDAPKLLPSDPHVRYQVRAIVDTICAGIQPLQNLTILQKLNEAKPGLGSEWAIEIIEKGFAGLEKMLSETSGKFCVGDQLTMADLCLVPQVYNARRYGVDLSKFPLIDKLNSALESHPAIAETHPSKMPDAIV